MRIKSLGLLAVVAMIAVSCGGTDPQAASGPQEGIAVHGDWTIEVYNADGSLDQKHEFSNALLPQGGAKLARVLGAADQVEGWAVVLGVGEPGGAGEAVAHALFSTITVPPLGSAPGAKLTLNASSDEIADPVNREIRWVQTRIVGSGSFSPENYAVTQTSLTPAILVQPLQTIHVTVEISFSD